MRALSLTAIAAVLFTVSCAEPPSEDGAAAQANSVTRADLPRRASAQLTVGGDHSCVLARKGVACWGRNTNGQLTAPTLRRPRQVVAGGNHTCALDDDGVKCWGQNTSGQTTVPPLRNPKLVRYREVDPFTLAPIAQGGVIDLYFRIHKEREPYPPEGEMQRRSAVTQIPGGTSYASPTSSNRSNRREEAHFI